MSDDLTRGNPDRGKSREYEHRQHEHREPRGSPAVGDQVQPDLGRVRQQQESKTRQHPAA